MQNKNRIGGLRTRLLFKSTGTKACGPFAMCGCWALGFPFLGRRERAVWCWICLIPQSRSSPGFNSVTPPRLEIPAKLIFSLGLAIAVPQSYLQTSAKLFFFFRLLWLYYFFSFIFINWRIINLQYCSAFCHTLTWISHGFTCVPHPGPPPASLPIPSPWVFPVHQARALV